MTSGLVSCDPAHRTPWGTIVFAEENGTSGRLFELVDPLHTTGVTIDGVGQPGRRHRGPSNIVRRGRGRQALIRRHRHHRNGVMYYGDENRPLNGTAGGAYFKFIPTCRPPCPVGSLPARSTGRWPPARSPRRAASSDCGSGSARSGTPTTGRARRPGWAPGSRSRAGLPINLRAAAATQLLTGYYRPEDLDFDLVALGDGNVRWCGNNTGNEADDRNYGETICLTDGTLAQAANTTTLSTPEVQFLVIGYPDFAMMDNIAYQPGRGNWVVHEDGDQLHAATTTCGTACRTERTTTCCRTAASGSAR